jgi:hypothetical protein
MVRMTQECEPARSVGTLSALGRECPALCSVRMPSPVISLSKRTLT